MSKITISMPDAMSEYIGERVAAGHYGDVSEYFRDLVKKDQAERRLTLDALRDVLARAEASGSSGADVPEIANRVERQQGVGRLFRASRHTKR